MRLLVTTQAVDLDDPTLGFFHQWLEELATRFDAIEVICLKSGRFDLPKNVRVHSLGKERGAASRAAYAWRFIRLVWRLRRDYDAVFVHMNEEYVLLFGPIWRLLGKRVVLWRNHKTGSLATTIAASLAHTVCYTSPGAFVATRGNAVQMPIGIDTSHFAPPPTPAPAGAILFLGRLDPVKKAEVFIEALGELARRGVAFHAGIYGEPTKSSEPYAVALKRSAEPLVASGMLTFHGAVANEETPAIYGAHAIYVNLTPSGSFDKTIGEAMACGCVVVCANDAVREVVSEGLMTRDDDAQDVARALERALGLSPAERAHMSHELCAYTEEHHSLKELIGKLANELINPLSRSTIRR